MNDDWKLPWDGGCMCARVRVRVSQPPLLTMACHCGGCQKLSSSAFSLTMAVPSDGFAVSQGELAIGAMHGPHRHWFCAHCKNWIYTQPHGVDFFVNVRPTLLDQHAWVQPFVEVYTSEKLPWAITGARHSFATQPDFAGYQPLVADFAQRAPRPT
jgi:hypothetical protein